MLSRRTLPLLLLALPAFGTEMLYLQQALQEALQNNHGYIASGTESRYAEEAVNWGNAGLFPNLDGTGGYTFSQLDTRQDRGGTIEDRSAAQSTAGNAGLNLNWTLFEGFAAPRAHKRLQLQRDKARGLERLTREELLRSTALAYADLVRQLRLRDALDSSAGISEERLRILGRSLEAGASAKPDWLEAHVDRNADRAALIRQEAILRSARLGLGQILGRKESVHENPESELLMGKLEIGELLAGLPERQPALFLAATDKALVEIAAQERAALWFPKLDARAGYNFSLTSSDAGFIRQNRTLGPSAGLQLRIPLFDGELPWRVQHRARLALEAAEWRRRESQSVAEAALQQSHAAWMAADSALALESEGLTFARENLSLTFIRWKSGSIGYLDARRAQEKFLESATRTENTAFEAFSARVDLLRAAGRMESMLEESMEPARSGAP